MINVKKTDRSCFEMYDSVSMNVDVRSEYRIKRLDNGLGGMIFEEVPVTPYVKDLSVYERATEYEKDFYITYWSFYMALMMKRPGLVLHIIENIMALKEYLSASYTME